MPGLYFDDRWAQLMWRRQKDYKVLSDAQPDKINYAIRLALIAKQKNLKHLPHFEALEISEHSF